MVRMTQDKQPMIQDMQPMDMVVRSVTSVTISVTYFMLPVTLVMPILTACYMYCPVITQEHEELADRMRSEPDLLFFFVNDV
jgi:cytochrome oxidase Cu insertion factor (SCO1/SenC/PrrC family)